MRFEMLKRDIRLFLRCLLPAAVLTAVFAAVCAAAALTAVKSAESVYTPVKAAVVDGEDSVYSRMLIHAVAKTDYLSGLMDVSRQSMKKAMKGLESGELAAVIVLPEGVIDGIAYGKDTKGTIYLSPAAAANADIVAGAASFGELLLASGQFGYFSGEQLMWKYHLDSEFRSNFYEQANALLIAGAMEANSEYFRIQVTDYANTSMSTAGYYIVGWSALLMLLSSLFFARLYTEDLNSPILCRLKALGVGDGQFLAGKLLYPALFQAVILTVILLAAKSFAPVSVDALSLACALPGVLLSAGVCGVFMLLSHRGIPLVVVTALAGLFLCGGIVPRQMLPGSLLTLGAVTPYGAVQGLLQPLLGGRVPTPSLIAAVIYLCAVPFAACLRLRHVRRGGDAQ
jgi:hypothetical protein